MNTIKSIFVAATLIAVGYGTHVVLNNPPGSSALAEPNIWTLGDTKVEATETSSGSFDLQQLTNDTKSDAFSDPIGNSVGASQNPFAGSINPGSQSQPTNPFATQDSLGSTSPDRIPGARPNLNIPSYPPVDSNPPSGVNPGPPVIADTSRPLATVPSMNIPLGTPAANAPAPDIFNTPANQVPAATNNGPVTLGAAGQPGIRTAAQTNFQQPLVTPAVPNEQTDATFAQTWQTAQNLMGNNELSDALATLSSIYNLPMHGEQRGQLVSLLDQLAGTVIYSQQHLMHPAYVPQQNETPAQIAVRQRVPADFLARVNGINPHQNLTPDIHMKIVTGPFRAEISRSRRELTVFLGKHYAGRFAISLGNEFPQQVTAFEVIEKSGAHAYVDRQTGQQISAGDPSNPYGAHWIGMQAAGSPNSAGTMAGTLYGLHSVGANIDAADSRGCIGLTENDADDLKAILELGSTVSVVD